MRHKALATCGCFAALVALAAIGGFVAAGFALARYMDGRLGPVESALTSPIALTCLAGTAIANLLWIAKGVSLQRIVLGNALLMLTVLIALAVSTQLRGIPWN